MVRTYRPGFSITAYKAITRADAGQPARLQGENPPWDLTPHLGDGSEISVSKSVKSPKGSFVITVPDQPYAVSPEVGGTDTLYGLLEPMDEIEIRLARSPERYGGQLPLLMRGFIRSIRRAETMGSDGKPQRTTIIQGHDYGWVFEITQLPPLIYLQYGLGLSWSKPWEFFFQIGADQLAMKVGEFFQLLLTHLIEPQLSAMVARFTTVLLSEAAYAQDPQGLATNSAGEPVKGQVCMASQDQLLGPIWNVFIQWADTPWNELWVEDPETLGDDPPVLRFRPAPYRTWIKGQHLLDAGETIPIMDQYAGYESVDLDIAAVVRLDADRSEQNVANIYWVESPTLSGGKQTLSVEMAKVQSAAANSANPNGSLLPEYVLLDGDEYPNSDPDLYGYRVMQQHSALFPDALTSGIDGQKKETLEQAGGIFDEWPDWAKNRRKALVAMNGDNVVLEEGELVVQGDERIRAGKYVRLRRNKFHAEYYAETVTHRFAPYRQYTTTIQFVRGTGFIERLRIPDSPYLYEGKQGVYS